MLLKVGGQRPGQRAEHCCVGRLVDKGLVVRIEKRVGRLHRDFYRKGIAAGRRRDRRDTVFFKPICDGLRRLGLWGDVVLNLYGMSVRFGCESEHMSAPSPGTSNYRSWDYQDHLRP